MNGKDNLLYGFLCLLFLCVIAAVKWWDLITNAIWMLFGITLTGLIFYVLPFVLLSIFAGLILAYSCKLFTLRKPQYGDYRLDYRMLAGVFPIILIIAFFAVGFPEEIKYVKEEPVAPPAAHSKKTWKKNSIEKKKETPLAEPREGYILQSPVIAQAYMDFKRAFGLKVILDEQHKPYDLNNVSTIVWLALVLGGPSVFWLFAISDQDADDKRIHTENTDHYKNIQNTHSDALSRRLSEINELKNALSEHRQEITKLKARDEFLTKKESQFKNEIESAAERPFGAGVLDTDVL